MQLKFEYENKTIDFELILSKRKTMSIEVSLEGYIRVRAPLGISNEVIIKEVSKKGNWIIEKKEQAVERFSKRQEKSYKDGDLFMYLGVEYQLKIKCSPFLKKISVKLIDRNLLVYMIKYDKEKLKRAIELWYREECTRVIGERVRYYLDLFKVKPRSVKIKEQKKRWGSCTYYNDLLFNWRCIMAPIEVIDYIVVHEMTHMIHKNHSKDYWNAVSKIVPNYKERNKWLKENGIRMEM